MTNLDSNSEAEDQHQETSDPILTMLGVGSDLWQHETGDSFVERLRSEDLSPTTLNTDDEI